MRLVLCFIFFSFLSLVNAQDKAETSSSQNKFTISGYVKEASSGETLIGANILNVDNTIEGTSTNAYGFYSLSLEEGEYILLFSYLGFSNEIKKVKLDRDIKLDVELSEGLTIDEVVISAVQEEKEANVQSTKMGVVKVPMESIKKLPAIFGEVDILKTLQLLPGVLSSGEGSAGFYVRGGGPDQNLILLDEAIVYNAGHMLGFFSVFNGDAIKNTTLIKGNMPARYGGRLSSVVDIQMKEGNQKQFAAEGGIGLVSSRLTLQGPIVKDKVSFIVSGRRTYILDLVQPALEGGDFEGTNYYFYDLNAKLNYTISDKDRLFLSAYFGRDILTFRQPVRSFYFDLPYGNSTATLRWNHLFSDKLFFNLSAIYNDYKLSFDGGQEAINFKLFSGVRDYNLKLDFDYYPNVYNSIKFGANYTYHKLTPNTATATLGGQAFNSGFQPKYANEFAFYISDEIKVNTALSIALGLRYSIFSQLGPHTSKLDAQQYDKFENVVTYQGLEPRLSMKYAFNSDFSFKAGFTLTNQYLHLVSNSNSTLPTDLWVPSTEIVKPQQSIQYAIGLFRNFDDNEYETSVELYYKDLRNQIDYSENYVQDLNSEDEDAFVFGKGRAYGAEFFVKKSTGRLNGWLGYTLSRSERSFKDIEDGRWFPTVYDRTHDLSLVANYKLAKKWDIGTSFVYGTGRNFTPYAGFYFIEQNLNVFYGPRNSERLEPYHRIDLSVTFTPKPDSKKAYKGSWTASIYNVYNRKNPFFTYYDANTDFSSGASQIEAYKVTLFPLIPSITYNFKFR